jgi:acyl carrier protein
MAVVERMTVIEGLKRVLRETLQIGDRVNAFDESTGLFGSIPEFDSMAVVNVVSGLEDQFDIEIDDDDITAEIFETVGALMHYVQGKLAG